MLARWLALLNVRSDELSRVLWLFLYSLLSGLFVAFFFSTAYSMFLDRFAVSRLPWAYIATALVGYVVVAVFTRLERRIPLRRVLLYQPYFVLAFVVTFWLAENMGGRDWVVFLMFVSVSPFLTLLELEFWGMAIRLFDLRQGKRLFGLLGAGGALASIIGFFTVPLLLRSPLLAPGQEVDVLLFGCVSLVLSIGVVRMITGRFRDNLEVEPGAIRRDERGLAKLLGDRYFVLIALLTTTFILCFYLVDLTFLTELKLFFRGDAGAEGVHRNRQMAAFVGLFYGTSKFLELLFKLFLSGKLVSQLGVRVGLTALPAVLLLLGLVALAAPQEAILFFLLIVILKLVWLVLRKGLFDASFKVLYQPLVGDERFTFQHRIEGAVSQTATLLVGVALVLYGQKGFAPAGLLLVLVPILVVWIAVAAVLHGEYRNRLMRVLSSKRQEGDVTSPVAVIREHLRHAQPDEVDYGLEVLRRVDGTALAPALVELAEDGPVENRVAVLHHIRRIRAFEAAGAVERCAAEHEPPEVRSAAAAAMRALQKVVAATGGEAQITRLLGAADPRDRELAALAIGWSAAQEIDALTGLLWDRDRRVRRHALLAAGRRRDPRFWPRIMAHLAAPEYSDVAIAALVMVGEPVLEDLEDFFGKVDQTTDVQLRILRAYEACGSPRARRQILDKLRLRDKAIHQWVLISLSHGGERPDAERAPEIGNEIEELVRRIAWNLAAIRDLADEPAALAVREALEIENLQSYSTLFRLLALLYDAKAIRLVEENLAAGNDETVVYALEILDVVVTPDLKTLVFPVIEKLTPAQRLKRLDALFPLPRMHRRERLSAILHRDVLALSSWTKACALEAITELTPERVAEELLANLFHPEAMLQEVAAGNVYRRGAEAYERHAAKLPREDKERLDRVILPAGGGDHDAWESRSLFGRVGDLRDVGAFLSLPWEALIRIAGGTEELEIETGDNFPETPEAEPVLYVVVEGRLGVQDETGALRVVPRKTLVAFGPESPQARVLQSGRIFRLQGETLYEQTSIYGELAPALLKAGSPQDIEELISLSRSFESTMSLVPSV